MTTVMATDFKHSHFEDSLSSLSALIQNGNCFDKTNPQIHDYLMLMHMSLMGYVTILAKSDNDAITFHDQILSQIKDIFVQMLKKPRTIWNDPIIDEQTHANQKHTFVAHGFYFLFFNPFRFFLFDFTVYRWMCSKKWGFSNIFWEIISQNRHFL